MHILACSSDRVDDGIWVTSRCDTCKGYDPDSPIHVSIRYVVDEERDRNTQARIHTLLDHLRRKYPPGVAHFSVEAMKELLETLDPQSDLGLELSIAIDEAVDVSSHIIKHI